MRTSLLRIIASVALAASAVVPAVAADVPVRLIGFNDFHGNINAPGNFSGNPAGGIDYLGAYVANLRATAPVPANTLVLHAGDMVGASPLVSALWHDEPTIEAMNKIGVDVASVGNHEFDEGRTELLRLQSGGCHPADANSCAGPDGTFTGAKFQFLAANVVDQATGKPLFPRYVVRTFGGIRMAFIGMTLEGTPDIVTPSGVAGLVFNDEARTVNALIRTLKNQGINAIAVVVHEGGNGVASISGCAGTGDIVPIVAALDDAVDLVISGHTHQAYLCRLPNSTGRNIPVTSASAFGRVLTRIDLVLDTVTRDVKSVTTEQVVVNRSNADITDDPALTPVRLALANLATHYNNKVAPIAGRVIGKVASDVTVTANVAGESLVGDLIADAQLAATAADGFGNAVIAFMNPGGIRGTTGFAFTQSGGEGNGNVTYQEAFNVQPFGNSLVTLTLTGAQIETLLEQQFVGCPNGQTFNRVMQVSAGFSYTWDNSRPACDKVDPATIRLNGNPIDPAASYRVTVNSFLATGGDLFFVLNEGTNRLGGAIDLDALENYFKPSLQPAPNGTPYVVPSRNRIQRLN